MIKIENVEVTGWESAIRGMRNPLNSWDKSDSKKCCDVDCIEDKGLMCDAISCDNFGQRSIVKIGDNDLDLMRRLARAGSDHAKYRRMITVYADIVAPLYWWKEYDTYKVGTVANSCSTMHKITSEPIYRSDFSIDDGLLFYFTDTIIECEKLRQLYLETKDKKYWRGLIQLLPSSYNQRRTVQLNYEVLANMYKSRKNHKLDEWRTFCEWVESLPYSDLITG